jgi:hypothetical protein
LPLIQEEIVEFCILRFWKKGYNFFEIRSWNLESNLELDIIKRQRVTHSAVRAAGIKIKFFEFWVLGLIFEKKEISFFFFFSL